MDAKLVYEDGSEVLFSADDPEMIEIRNELLEITARIRRRKIAKLVTESMTLAIYDLEHDHHLH